MLAAKILLLVSFTSLAVMAVGSMLPKNSPATPDLTKFAATLMIHGGILVMVHQFLKQHAMSWKEFLGLNSPRLSRALVLAVSSGILVVPLLLGLSALCAQLMTRSHITPVEQTVVTMVKVNSGLAQRIAFAIGAIVFAPIVEETMFRGILYPFIKQQGGKRLALFGTSLLFALIHANVRTFLPLALFALLLAWIYERTDTLLAPITTHAVFNAVNFAFLLYEAELNQFWQHLCERI